MALVLALRVVYLDPAATPATPPAAKPVLPPTNAPVPTNPAAAAADPNAPRIDSADEDDGVALVVGTRRPGAPARVQSRAVKRSEPADDEKSGFGSHLWLWAAAGGVVIAGVVMALALSGGQTQNGSLGSIDLR